MPAAASFDVIIIGGGPAGISCGLELHESKLNVVVLERKDQLGGQLADIRNTLRNFAGGFYESGEPLRVQMAALADQVGLPYLTGHAVTGIDLATKLLTAEKKKFKAKAIVLATGYRVTRLGVGDEDSFGKDISYQSEDIVDHLSGHPIAVIGGGDSALMEALFFADRCPQVYLVHRGTKFKARPDVIKTVESQKRIKVIVDTVVHALHGDRELTGVRLASTTTGRTTDLPVKRLLVKIGYTPNTERFAGQVKMDASGHILVDQECATSMPGVFAAGDIAHPGYPRIGTAMGQGMIASWAVRRYLGMA